MNVRSLFLLLGGSLICSSGAAAVWLAPLFSDGAVLQRDRPIPVWGRADVGESIQVRFAETTVSTVADDTGRWMVFLDARPASPEPRDLTVQGDSRGKQSKVHVRDILVGDVWLLAGQSNIEWPLRLSDGGAEAAAAANFPAIRHLKIPRTTAAAPREEVQANWKTATAEDAPHFSAIGFYFARELQAKISVPIGLINCTYGGTPIESWFEPSALAGQFAGAVYIEKWHRDLAKWSAKWAEHQAALPGAAAGASLPNKPWPPAEHDAPSGAFNGMVYSLPPYAIRGVVWYQGESNVKRADHYRALFPALIRSWREHWGLPELPFLFVQLPNWIDRNDETNTAWAELREAQTAALELPATAMAVAVDQGDPENLHPTQKLVISQRLASLAGSLVYGLPGETSSPRFKSARREGGTVRVTFSHTGGGLVLRKTTHSGVELAGPDGTFHPASARVEGDAVMVHSADVPEPKNVRYAWDNDPAVTLYSNNGLPVVPFHRAIE